jgi:Rrf2 family protein
MMSRARCKALLAIALVVDVALQVERGRISAETLAMRHGMAPRSLEPMLRSLVHGGILKGTRGPHGGYELRRDQSVVTLSDILRAVDIGDPEEKPKSEIVAKIVLPVLSIAEQAFGQTLNQIKLDDLVRNAKAVKSIGLGSKMGSGDAEAAPHLWSAAWKEEQTMSVVYIEAGPKGRQEGSPIEDYVVEDHADSVLATFKTQHDAVAWAKREGHTPHVARVRHLNKKSQPDHWRAV